MPFLFHSRGPLLFAVIALSAMERSRLLPIGAVDYDFIAHEYKAKSLAELQDRLADPQAAEENLMTCVLQASLEITGGSQPTWLLHLRGALAILRHFTGSISPEAAYFALQYFHFRYALMKTTELAEHDTPAILSSTEVDLLGAAMSQAPGDSRGQKPYPDSIIDEHLGCSLEMVELIFHIAEVATAGRQEQRLRSPQSRPLLEFRRIDERLQRMIFFSPEVEGNYLLRSATCFKVAAELYLRLMCANIAINDPIILTLEEKLLAGLSLVIADDQPRRSFPMWPLFIAGCASIDDEHRKKVLGFFRTLDRIWPISNIATVSQVVWTIWQTRDLCMRLPAEQRRDWQEIIHKFGWKLALS
jgi:Fungal specific transcription factor domain